MAEKPVLTIEERRARRAERREKQRVANVGRAEKMHAARLELERASLEKEEFIDKENKSSKSPKRSKQNEPSKTKHVLKQDKASKTQPSSKQSRALKISNNSKVKSSAKTSEVDEDINGLKTAERLKPSKISDTTKSLKQKKVSGSSQALGRITSSKSTDYELPEFNIGCSGWYYWHWHKIFYPENIPRSKWFPHYAKNFKTVELNAPFYSWPTIGTVNTWIKQGGRRKFVYTIKVSELITHVKRFEDTAELICDFGLIADLLGSRMGCFLFQLPPSYHYSPERLNLIVSQLDPSRRNVVEFRHKSWWNEDVYKTFRKKNIIFCSCSGPRLPDELVTTADQVYIRFHGTKQWYRHNYSREELSVWVDRIRASKAKRVWAYFNNDRDGYAIKNAKELERLLKAK